MLCKESIAPIWEEGLEATGEERQVFDYFVFGLSRSLFSVLCVLTVVFAGSGGLHPTSAHAKQRRSTSERSAPARPLFLDQPFVSVFFVNARRGPKKTKQRVNNPRKLLLRFLVAIQKSTLSMKCG